MVFQATKTHLNIKTFYILLICLLSVSCLYSSNSDVKVLTQNNFNKEVVNSPEIWIVEFYAPWCGHCQKLTPEWEKAAKALKGIVKVGAVDADAEKVYYQLYH
jgi:protein disulfide-isomerase A6